MKTAIDRIEEAARTARNFAATLENLKAKVRNCDVPEELETISETMQLYIEQITSFEHNNKYIERNISQKGDKA